MSLSDFVRVIPYVSFVSFVFFVTYPPTPTYKSDPPSRA